MSELEKSLQGFLQRWSRRKLAAADRAAAPDAVSEESASAEASLQAPAAADSAVAAFDPASLPPIESIGAATDLRPFLAAGVPLELKRAALRRAWTSDPAIRDFIGLAENQWDFTQTGGVPGFGSLELTPELRRTVAELFDQASAHPAPNTNPTANSNTSGADLGQPEPFAPPTRMSSGSVAPSPAATARESVRDPHASDAAAQDEIADQAAVPASASPRHGGALPK